MLLKSSLISFFELSYMKHKIPKIMKTSSIMMNWYILHIIYIKKKFYMSTVKKNFQTYIMCSHVLYSVIFRNFFVIICLANGFFVGSPTRTDVWPINRTRSLWLKLYGCSYCLSYGQSNRPIHLKWNIRKSFIHTHIL